jgi:hypothetical protein
MYVHKYPSKFSRLVLALRSASQRIIADGRL